MIKKILSLCVLFFSIFLIYLGIRDDKIYFLTLGDFSSNSFNGNIKDHLINTKKLEVYYDNFVDEDYRATDIINFIKNNESVTDLVTIQNNLIKADLLTLSVGKNDFIDNLNFSYEFSMDDLYKKFQEFYFDLDLLFTYLRKYCKETIVFIGFYNSYYDDSLNDFYSYVNKTLESLSHNYNIKYIDLELLLDADDYIDGVINENGNKKITKEILKIIE